MSEYSYNGLGQLSGKSYHNASADSLYYTYNVRGWLTGIYGEKFVEGVNYSGLYNGNIRSINWGTLTNRQSYTYIYDGLSRLTEAIHSGNRFNEKVTEYDKNGNIKKLQRYGQTGASSYGLVDNLTYTYNGNQLTKVEDAVTATSYTGGTNFINGASTSNEYVYDQNGNMTKDLNKNISNIQYNSLNLPSVVTFNDGSTITYTYTHDGKKLRTVHVIGGVTTTTDYCGNVIYENGTPKRLLTDEGYVDLTATTPTYYYYLKDHQGNNRAVINSSGTVQETNHYYPFGGLFSTSTNVQPYKYNGKELDTKKGLNLYDYGARHYDAALGRFTTFDPLSEKDYLNVPYGYCGNNPIIRIDRDGKAWDTIWDLGNLLYDVGAAIYNHIQGDHAQAQSHWKDAGADALAMAVPIVPAGVTKLKYADDVAGAAKATNKADDVAGGAKFGGKIDTNSTTANEAFRKAKDQNSIPRSQQPDKTIKPNTAEGNKAELRNDNVKLYEFTNSKGEKIHIRQDKSAKYDDGGIQPPHFNAGNKEELKLKQHHNYGN